MIFTIPAGKHRARPFRFGFSLTKKVWRWQVQFTDSCRYRADVEDDTNKLCGVGFLPGHHTNSARFGWRSTGDQISLWAYTYDEGVRSIHHIYDVPLNTMIDLELHNVGYAYIFHVGDKQIMVSKNHRRVITYRLGLYFGGNATAPHEMKISITRV